MKEVSFEIVGAPRTKSNHSQAFRTPKGRLVILPSKPYRKWCNMASQQVPIVRAAFARFGVPFPLARPVEVKAVFFRDRDSGDEDNYFKGLGDWLQRCGFVKNDRLIHWSGESRLDIDRERPRIEIAMRYDDGAQMHGG